MLNPGQILDGKYEILEVLGQGGMGKVYLCKNKRLGNLWAVKEVGSHWKDKVDFLAEPNILKNLNHSGIVRIIDIFYEDDNLYIVEDYIKGQTLEQYVKVNGPLDSQLLKDFSLQLCSILDYLHSFDIPIVYRDLKPSNIMITPSDKVVLIDFGIARTYKESQNGDTVILGSRGYIAPEQLHNVQSNAQTDIYALGATMFFMLTAKSITLPTETMAVENYPEHTDKELITVIQRASAIDPKNRYSDIKTMVMDLETVLITEAAETVLLGDTKHQFEQTVLIDNKRHEAIQAVLDQDKKQRNKTKFTIITVLVFTAALAAIFSLMTGKKATSVSKTSTAVETKSSVQPSSEPKAQQVQQVQQLKPVVEQDKSVTGILDTDNAVILNTSRGKGKDKDKSLMYKLNPAASVSNSKLSISLNSIIVMDNDVTAVLTVKNTADPALKLDLSKTYLVNGNNKTAKTLKPDGGNLVSIAQSTGSQELKLYFKDFEFKGSDYTLKTVLSSGSDKNIYLNVDVKGDTEEDSEED